MDAPAKLHPTDQTLSSYGLGKLDDMSSASVSQHLEDCASCQRRVAELSSDEFLGRLRQAKVVPDKIRAEWSPSATSSSDSAPGSVAEPPTADTLPPELVDHPDWEIIRELGRGGMGVVYLAENRLMGRLEVLKVVGRQLIERPGVLDRFLREIQSAARLQHANIVTAYSAMRLGPSLVLTMEYVEGYDLAKMVKSNGPLPVAHACYFVYQAALGLQHAHERGMVHRDIKPANLILARDGKKAAVKVLDFGLAKVTSEGQTDSNLTREGQMLGTPDFIAPEQIRNAQAADIRADIYSLGCTFYYLLTGGPPFRGDHLWDVYQAHFSMEAGSLNLVRPEVPVELAAVVAKMMAKEPRRRFQTPAEVAQALVPFFKKVTLSARMPSAEVSQVGQQAAQAKPVEIAPVPTQAATSLARVVAPPVTRPPQPDRAEPKWESPIEFKETEPLTEAVPRVVAKPSRTRPVWLWPATAAGVLLLGFFAVWAGIPIVGETPNGQASVKPKPRVNSPPAESSSRESDNVATGVQLEPLELIKNSIGMTLKLIPAGGFMMGSSDAEKDVENEEKPPHRVRITRPFYLGVYEVTQAEYEAVMGTHPSCFSANGEGKDKVANQSTDRHPVEHVSWLDAVRFCNRLSEKEGLAAFYKIDIENVTVPNWYGPGYRLPTEAEWEYACRANSPTRYSFGDDADDLSGYGWYNGNSENKTHAVGEKTPNGFGLFDMHGNVWEWCWDWYGTGYYQASPVADPRGVDVAVSRVIRGGGWGSAAGHCRAATRRRSAPTDSTSHSWGFRLARVRSVR